MRLWLVVEDGLEKTEGSCYCWTEYIRNHAKLLIMERQRAESIIERPYLYFDVTNPEKEGLDIRTKKQPQPNFFSSTCGTITNGKLYCIF